MKVEIDGVEYVPKMATMTQSGDFIWDGREILYADDLTPVGYSDCDNAKCAAYQFAARAAKFERALKQIAKASTGIQARSIAHEALEVVPMTDKTRDRETKR